MMRINLLPHREERRKERQKQFAVLAGGIAVLGLAVAALLWVLFDGQVENQMGRNKYLNDEIAKLEKQIDEIKKIREETASLLGKKQVVEAAEQSLGTCLLAGPAVTAASRGALSEVDQTDRHQDQCHGLRAIECAGIRIHAQH